MTTTPCCDHAQHIADLKVQLAEEVAARKSSCSNLAAYVVACWRAAGVNVPAVPDIFAVPDESPTAQVIQLFGGVSGTREGVMTRMLAALAAAFATGLTVEAGWLAGAVLLLGGGAFVITRYREASDA